MTLEQLAKQGRRTATMTTAATISSKMSQIRKESIKQIGEDMKIIIQPQGTLAIYEQIVSQLKDAIVTGDLKAGEALPSIRALAGDLQLRIGDHGVQSLAGGLALGNGHLHSLMGNQLTHGIMGIDNGGNGSFKNDLGLGIDLDHTLFDALVIADHTLHTVGLNAVKVRGQQHILNDVGFGFGKAVKD